MVIVVVENILTYFYANSKKERLEPWKVKAFQFSPGYYWLVPNVYAEQQLQWTTIFERNMWSSRNFIVSLNFDRKQQAIATVG